MGIGRAAGAALAAAGVAGLAGAAWAGLLDGVPLLDGRVAGGVETAGGALLLAALWGRDRRWRTRTLPVLLLCVAALVAAVAVALRATGTVTDGYPPSFALWVGTGFAALAGLPLVLRRAGRWRRASAVAAVPLTLIGGFMLIDQRYGVWPDLGDALGHSGALAGAVGRGRPARGVAVALDAPATRSRFRHRPGAVFLPPAYFGPGRATLPVLVLLAGTPGAPINWLRSGHAQATDEAFAAAHRGRAPVLVVVDQNGSATGDTECVDGPHGAAETYLTVDVPAFVTGTLGIRHAAGWGVAGFSEGGTCALDLVLRHPAVYRHAVDLGGDPRPSLGGPAHTLAALYGGDAAAERAHDPARLLDARRYPGVTLWFGAGADDRPGVAAGKRLAADAVRDGVVTHRFVAPGGHNWQFASAGFARVLPPLCAELTCS
ncbi:alpha/beta hydrolase [Dactylosporangium sp. CA-092794]|uniref:alpha/beta hydrolase n=1 Tax=Dactylosporangium sp. CA-092794 TaxID=3239929 RepID=UPI003D92B02E